MTTFSLKPRFRPRPGHAEIRVLVGQVQVAGVVGGFRDAPGHAERRRRSLICRLTIRAARLLDQAAGRRAHHERGHQILEHRSRPGDQGGAAIDGRDGSTQAKPVPGRDIALGDGHEAREPRFGGEQVVAARVESSLGDAIADRQELSLGIRRKPNSIGPGHGVGTIARARQGGDRGLLRRPVAPRRRAGGYGSSRVNGLGPARHFGAGRILLVCGEVASAATTRSPSVASLAVCPAMSRRFTRNSLQRVCQGIERRIELAALRSLRAGPVREVAQRVAGEQERVPDAGDPFRMRRAAADDLPQALASAIRWPARLPLSTEETYLRLQRAQVCVSYQLKKWPRKRWSCSIVASVASSRSTVSSVPIQPKSRAATTERR